MTIVGILALQGDFAEHQQMIEVCGAEPRQVRLPSQLDELDGLIIPGGESTTIARLLDAYDLLEPLRSLARENFPIWGTCAGAIILAKRAPGLDRPNIGVMDIGVARNAFGRQIDSFETDLSISECGAMPFHAVFIRAPVITDVAGEARVLAQLDGGRIVAAVQGKLLATAFHPELTGDRRMHEYFLRLIKFF